MRLRTTLVLLPVLTSGLVALPTVSVPAAAAAPAPVAPEVRNLAVDGIDPEVLARSPEPEPEPEPESESESGDALGGSDEHAELAPVAVSEELVDGSFSAVGVTWLPDPALDEVAVQVRTRAEGRWGDWTHVEVQLGSGSDAASSEAERARAGSDLLFVGPSDAVQVRVDSAGAQPQDVRVSLIDPGASRADRATVDGTSADTPALLGGAVAEATGTTPAYVSRTGWGADESLRKCANSTAPVLRGGILHTTATSNDYTAEQSPAVMRSMYAYHTKSLKWCDLGYNFLVDKYGTLFEGRAGSVELPVIGSHTGGFNRSTLGVSMIGHHDLVAPTPAALRTVAEVFAWKLGSWGLDPQGTVRYTSAGGSATKHPIGTVLDMPMISGHRDYSPKSCPGNLAYPLLDSIRSAVAARISAYPLLPPPPPSAQPPAPPAPAATTAPSAPSAPPAPPASIVVEPPAVVGPVSPPAAPTPTGSRFVPLPPVRAIDTRTGNGGRQGPLTAGEEHDLVLAGARGVPADATAVALNLTGTDATAATHLTVWPSGGVRPDTSVLNLVPGATAASLVVAGLGSSGATTVRNLAGNVHLVADVVGYWKRETGGLYHPVGPARLLDSRTAGGGARRLTDAEVRTVAVAGRSGVPATATAVILNVTAVGPARAGYLTVTPSGARSGTSSVNFATGQTVPNRVVTGLSPDGRIDVLASRATHVLVDVVGWFGPSGAAAGSGGSVFHAVAPTRLVDSRNGTGTHRSAFGPAITRDVQTTGRAGIPAGATAAVVSLTATAPTAAEGFVAAFADGQRRPGTSDLNTAAGQTRSNLAVVQLSRQGRMSLYNATGRTHVVVDVLGYYATE